MPLRHDAINLRPSKELQRKLELVSQHPSFTSVTETLPIRTGKFAWLPVFSAHPDTVNFPTHRLVVQGKAQGDDNNWYLVRVYEILPGPEDIGAEMSSQFGGGLLKTTRQDVDDTTYAGSAIIAGSAGLNIVSVSVQPDEQTAKFMLVKSELPQGESWPTLTEWEYITELQCFVKTEKTFVAVSAGNTPSRVVEVGGDIVVTEFKDYDKWKCIRVKSTLPAAVIGSSRTFKKPIQYSVPAEIPVAPTLVKAYAAQPPPAVIDTIAEAAYVTDYGFNWSKKDGYSGPFTAEVTRTVSLTASTETGIRWQEQSEMRNIPITLNSNQGSIGVARGKIIELRFPSCIHGEWTIDFGKVFTVTGQIVNCWDDAEKTMVHSGFPVTQNIGDAQVVIPTLWWSLTPIIEATDLTVTFPATTPAVIPRGTPIIATVNSSEWRFGVFINDVYRIVIP